VDERSQLQRQLREQKREREARLLDLGAIVYELHRQGKRAPELLQQKAAALMLIDNQVRELEAMLAGETLEPHPLERDEAPPSEQTTEEADALELEEPEPEAAPEPEPSEEHA
jgi:hypothetical protein